MLGHDSALAQRDDVFGHFQFPLDPCFGFCIGVNVCSLGSNGLESP